MARPFSQFLRSTCQHAREAYLDLQAPSSIKFLLSVSHSKLIVRFIDYFPLSYRRFQRVSRHARARRFQPSRSRVVHYDIRGDGGRRTI